MNANQDNTVPDGSPAGDKHPSAEELLAQNDDLQNSLTSLAALTTKRFDLEQLLTRVAEYAVQAIPGADGAGLTLLEEGRSDTIVATAPFVREVDTSSTASDKVPASALQRRPAPCCRARWAGTRDGPGSGPESLGSASTVPSRCRWSPTTG